MAPTCSICRDHAISTYLTDQDISSYAAFLATLCVVMPRPLWRTQVVILFEIVADCTVIDQKIRARQISCEPLLDSIVITGGVGTILFEWLYLIEELWDFGRFW